MFNFDTIIKERATLAVSNRVVEDVSNAFTEALVADLKLKEVRAVYPLIKAINSGRVTRNFTFYPAESLIGKNKGDEVTGYASFVRPYGKPIIREHQAQTGLFETADVPMGRIVLSGFRRRQEKIDGPSTMPSKKHIPGTLEGDGVLYAVPAITDPEAIVRVLGGAYQTVSIGSRVENVWESISGKNIAELRRKGEELPPYERGQLYEGKLSYWRMGEIKGVELSFVNVPSDEFAGVIDPDIGTEGIRLLMAEKKLGKNEFNFYDAKTKEHVDLSMDSYLVDESFFTDSAKVGQDIWWLHDNKEVHTESDKGEKTIMTNSIKLEDATLDQLIAESSSKELEALETHFKNDQDTAKIVNGDSSGILNADLFTKASEFATTLYGDWNEKAASLALGIYLKYGGEYVPALDSEKVVTVGTLYNLPEDHAEFSAETELTSNMVIEMTQDSFLGENRTFPVLNVATALKALELAPLSKVENKDTLVAKVREKALSFGISKSEDSLQFHPVLLKKESGEIVPLLSIRSNEEFQEFLTTLSVLQKTYGLTDAQTEQLSKFTLKETFEQTIECAPTPLFLGVDNLISFVVSAESTDNKKELAALVGLARKGKIFKEDIEEAHNAYKVFGISVLKHFMEKVSERPAETPNGDPEKNPEESSNEPPEVKPVETLSDPVAVTETNSKATPLPTLKKESNSFLGLRPNRNGKNKSIK